MLHKYTALLFLIAVGLPASPQAHADDPPDRPNIILLMFDDLGYGDLGYQNSEYALTPHIDKMAESSLVFNRFYAAAPVCSPTRGSALTGRHPFRYGIYFANTGSLPENEPNLAVLLRENGYRTGHFGKWHLGTLTTEIRDANRGRPGNTEHFAPPWQRGFDVCFSTESKVPTYDPLIRPHNFDNRPGNLQHWWDPVTNPDEAVPYNSRYWNERGEIITDNASGPNAKVMMDRAIPFIEDAVQREQPFFAVIWFHEPHWPVVAGEDHTKPFADLDRFSQHYYGCIKATDDQIGRLRAELRRLNIADNTMLWLTSDNGPEGNHQQPGTAHHFRGRKRDLYEGGIRVPGLLEWPARITEQRSTDIPAVTSDYLPTIADALGIKLPADREFDGVSLLPLIENRMAQRSRPIAFQSRGRIALSDDRYKLVHYGEGQHFAQPPWKWELYDLIEDPSESNDIAADHSEIVKSMAAQLQQWNESIRGDQ